MRIWPSLLLFIFLGLALFGCSKRSVDARTWNIPGNSTHVNNPLFIDDTELFVSYPGGDKKLQQYLEKNIQHNDKIENHGVKILVLFTVDINGKVGDVQIQGVSNEELVNEISNVFLHMKPWQWDKKLPEESRKKVNKGISLILN